MTQLWRAALGADRRPSADQEAAIVAPPTGRRSVNAGAGTGKTSTLALRALYLIETGHVLADQIVVVTFTKKAAAEVSSRIADTLDRALANSTRFSRSDRSVKCTTIHALSAEILREFAFESGAPAPLRPISDGEAYGIFHAAFRALLDGKLAVATDTFPIAELNLATLERDLAKLALRLKNYGVPPADFASAALAWTDRFERQSWGQLWALGKNGKRIGLEPKAPVTAEERAREAGRERANITVVAALLADFDRRLTERSAATYGDLIALATRLLRESPSLVKRLRERWRYLLLDESQDTSELQLQFIETLFGKPGDLDAAGMMPVGDTRQAIYGFNGAAEDVMERLALAADASHPLVVNRRSPQEIVDAGHAVLKAHEAVAADAPSLVASSGNRGLGCVRLETFGEAGGSIKEHVEYEAAAIAREIERLLHDGSAASSDIAILVRRRTHAAAYVRALNNRGICAALDRRSGLFVADEIRDALAWASLLLDLHDGQAAVRVLQSPLVGLSDAAMIALTARKDWLERFLLGDVTADIDADTQTRLDRARTMLTDVLPAAALPLRSALASILAKIPIAASYVRMAAAIGAQAIVNLRSFEELAREFAAERSDARLDDFVADAKRRIAFDDDPQEPELELTGVRILTIHQAKGLEWPFVFVACSTKNQYGSSEPTDRVVAYDLVSGAFALKNDADGRETFHWMTLNCEHDGETGMKSSGARKAAYEREQARVFYVALTRAKRRVYITAPASAGRGEAPYLAAIRDWAESVEHGADLRFDTAPTVEGARAPELTPARMERLVSPSVAVAKSQPPSRLRPRVSFSAISAFATCPRMARLRYRLMLPELRQARPRFVSPDEQDNPIPSNAARLGSLTHRALELWGRAEIENRILSIDDAFAGALLEFADAQPDEIERARSSARHAVAALSGHQVLAVEAPFEITVSETRVEGYIDLIAREPGGRLVVVDYKTGRTEDEHYALQIALYRRVAEGLNPGEAVAGAILRLTPDAAALIYAAPLPDADLDLAVAEAGSFESDAANVGPWCTTCAYRGSPCLAPLAKPVDATRRQEHLLHTARL
jgi:DNA helicase-2/ATP-dependent DNA helicase PcrA